MFPPIEITLYKNDEPVDTFRRNTIPWGLLKKAISLQKQFEGKETGGHPKWQFWKKNNETTKEEAQMTAISQFVVELFGNQFTVRQLEEGADISEIMTVFRAVMMRASVSVKENPTSKPPSKT